MAELQIIGIPQSTYVRAVRMLCEEKGVPYDLKADAPPHCAEVAAIHPFGKVPVMRHGGLELGESTAIAMYIDRAFDGPKLIPDDPVGQAKTLQWISLVNTSIDPVMIREYVLGYLFAQGGNPDRQKIGAAVDKMRKQFQVLDQATASGHLSGDRLTFADLNLMPILFYVVRHPEGQDLMKQSPNLARYFETHAQRPSFVATKPPRPRG